MGVGSIGGVRTGFDLSRFHALPRRKLGSNTNLAIPDSTTPSGVARATARPQRERGPTERTRRSTGRTGSQIKFGEKSLAGRASFETVLTDLLRMRGVRALGSPHPEEREARLEGPSERPRSALFPFVTLAKVRAQRHRWCLLGPKSSLG